MKLLLADDHLMVRKGLRLFLQSQPDIEIVGEASTGLEAVTLAEQLQPDVVLMDLIMPEMDGIEATKQLKQKYPGMKIIILTSFSDQDHVLPAIRAGAEGYQLKDIDPDELIYTIRAAFNGKRHLHPQATNQLMSHMTETNKDEEAPRFETLTKRERDVLREITLGKSNKEIAASLYITEKTVKTHVSSILSKLNVHDRTQAALLATKKHWSGEKA
ncbi:response regulator [Pseudalkalibacillus hwajinpoensis]|uniref:Response regulator transcription factor n=1 Tax=Guptibacillus hwajinpoensis TaxID=208199 RepID=A0A4U1MF06_9BACL|nr:response regulator transcription factor [Pseudalkalibacillus hwajinpoensis]TKD68806.1 response regulator transcription factor [Pseudalkalibacillus hwajinpoensis]